MMDLQHERDALLKYVLMHPPSNVKIVLPANVNRLEDVDMATCPLPLDTYAKAEAGSPSATFVFDVSSQLTFQSEGRSEVVRTGASGGGGSRPDGGASPATKAQLANNAMTTVAGEPVPPASPAPPPPAAAASPLSASEEGTRKVRATPAPSATSPAADTAASSTTGNGASTSLFNFHWGAASKSHHSPDNSRSNSNNNSRTTGSPAETGSGKLSGVRGLRAYLPQGLLGMGRGQERKAEAARRTESTTMSERGCERNSASASTLAPVRSWSFMALHGTTSGSLRDTVGSWLATVPPRKPLPFGAFPELYNVSLCPLFDSTMLLLFMNDPCHTVYEHVLMANALLLGPDGPRASQEIYNIYMPAFGLTETDHMQCMTNLLPPALHSAESRRRALSADELAHLTGSLQCNETTLHRLITNSRDEDFIGRMTDMLHTVRTYRDQPEQRGTLVNSAPYPFVIRATLFAMALVPLYRLDPSTGRPYAGPGGVKHTLAAMKRLLSIPDELVDYCDLHAHLYANEEAASDLQTQSSFLKGIARAVNTVVVNDSAALHTKDLTPEVKYRYYVLQETLSLAMTPMPWLETLWSGDALRSVSALFIEVCLSLPPCFLSVFVLVDGQPLLMPDWSSGTCLLELLSFFMTVSAFRRFGDVVPDNALPGQGIGDLLQVVQGVDDAQLAYAEMLSKSFPHARSLVCPLRMQFATYVLRQHWRVAPWYTEGSTCEAMGKALVANPPPDLAESINKVLAYLLDVTREEPVRNRSTGEGGAGDAHEDELTQTMEVLAVNAGFRLHGLQPIIEHYDALWLGNVQSALRAVTSKGGWAWEKTSLARCTDVPAEAKQLVHLTVNVTDMPPPLGSNPAQIYTTRLNLVVEFAVAFMDAITDGVPGVLPASRAVAAPSPAGAGGVVGPNGVSAGTDTATNSGGGGIHGQDGHHSAAVAGGGVTHSRSASQGGPGVVSSIITSALLHPSGSWKPQPLVVCDRLMQYHTQYLSASPKGRAGPTAPELVQRLNTLHLVRQELSGVLLALQRQYERVARVTGAPAVDHASWHEHLRSMLREAERQLCESLGAAAVLRPSFLSALTEKLLRWDEKTYKSLKRKDREALTHYPLAFPDVTLDRLLADLDHTMLELMPLLPPGAAAEFRAQTGLFFVCLLYQTLLEGEGVFLTPLDAQPILSLIEEMRAMFFPQRALGARGSVADPDGTCGGCSGGGGTHQRSSSGGVGATAGARRLTSGADVSPGEQRLNELCNVVCYVMSQPSSLLIGGGNGVPPLSSLPDRADNSPWCRFIVHRVLNHRKDKDAKKQASERGGFWGS